jgi:nucleolar protein 56
VSEVYIVSSPIGVFGINDKGKIEDKALFSKDVEATATALRALRRGEVIGQVKDVVSSSKAKGFKSFILEDAKLGNSLRSLLEVEVEVKKGGTLVSGFRARLAEIAVELGFVETPIAYNSWVRDVTASIVRAQVKLSSARRDLQVVQGVLTLDDLDKSLNLYAGRVREWYGLYFPELGDLVERHEPFFNLVLSFCDRSSFDVVSLNEIGFSEEKSRAIVEAASDSLGAEVGEEDLEQIRSISELSLKMYTIRRNLESHLEVLMRECAPNITVLVGSSIGARLLALAGGLDKLARMPASTIQVLGAESALFRSLKTGSPPPKHGIIFQSPLIHQAARWKRGKIARALAGKLAIAARIDAFSDRNNGESLKREVERRVEEIDRKYRVSPKRGRRKTGGRKSKNS